MPFEGPIPALDLDCDFWSLRFVEETSECYAVRKNVPQPLQVTHRPRRDGDRLRRRRLRLRRDVRHVAGRARERRSSRRWAGPARRPRSSLFDTRTLPRAAATRRVPVAVDRFAARARAATGTSSSTRSRARPRSIRGSSTGKWRVEVRNATHRLVTSAGGDVVQRYRFLFASASATAHANGDTQTRTLGGPRSICQQGGDRGARALRLRRRRAARRRGGARARARARIARAARWTCCSRPTR